MLPKGVTRQKAKEYPIDQNNVQKKSKESVAKTWSNEPLGLSWPAKHTAGYPKGLTEKGKYCLQDLSYLQSTDRGSPRDVNDQEAK